ncbi:hypothetical protein QFC22_006218 [Naganishia vaughanmartiniae]|uniref:Uncharacterized protein n=1 Tax=Naganishia vaughanmartiniae TaxID=1424756 RepID=A0ACC2WMM9_9TREE|nr:hypothetical protein QFC22_006218 [Naganishia vaughanmartiniae]
MQPFPPSTSRTGKLEPPLHSSFQADNNRYANEMKISPCRHHLRRRLSPTATPVEHTAERYRTRHFHKSGNSSDDDEGRAEDVLDTAPPSDLDARFPALSPQPSPLNSRRRHTREFHQTPHTESVSPAADRQERDQTRANEDVFASGGQARYDIHSLSFAEESQEDNSRWNATQDLVNSFLSTRKQEKQNPKTRGDQQGTTALESGRMSPDLTQRFHPGYRENGSTGTHQSDTAMLQRLDTVTDEVHALRNQVADLVTLISRALVVVPNPRAAEERETGILRVSSTLGNLARFI